ncbi:MAG TPA: hypothetical protein PLC42_03435 [Parachlamydiaceae bacterium]|nr:hypothetical protein [Parachlamydiaceae bacterium]
MQNLKFLIYFFLLCQLTSCTPHKIAVQTRYFSREDLASFYVGTQDPLQNDPPVGQQLLIFWKAGKDFYRYKNMAVRYKIRLANRKEIEDAFIIREPKGYFTYSLFGDDYFKSGGIATYKAELIGDGEIIEEWCQHLWKELIQF